MKSIKDHVENAGLTAYLFELNTEKSIDCKDVNEVVSDGLCPY